ncbi:MULTISPECIES: diaminopimelate epimerase [Methanothermobacter]|uniref:Diaminopimelate epimerase n=1 Tax=Methanothermobacter marburgensis (strain ATCC BAA-927 / DSM 2133 / JCM 14651 / NBRC 100331 / OCM 82 / Marburg) TaxID=79929 RepID=D9PYI7_METTM|nr:MULTISPECIES: diaminopimelate epimerase [Methanothermobacter]ADL59285.1 diaminopimelate epimerase [Methanothermobacter marburgensis str. Marburg]QHN07700.1 diaminopimelate epimerase [Methanothermobacter sp. THM-2]WBF09783.1 diaminopimelate epimerase [Methanothermobacter marburgensis]
MTRMVMFSKMHGLGNDYVVIDESTQECIPEDKKPEFVREVCTRGFSVGADGVIFVQPAAGDGDIRFRIFNADGSEAEMCGNGIRCFSKFVYDNAIVRKRKLDVETLAGIKTVELEIGDDGSVVSSRVDMGTATFKTDQIPMDVGECEFIDRFLPVEGEDIKLTALSVGNPHAVIFVDDTGSVDLKRLGPAIENHPLFPERINVHFVEVVDPSEIIMVTWERGAGPTMACGTGATASVIAGVKLEKLDDSVLVHLPGGELKIDVYQEGTELGAYMEGDAVLVFDGILVRDP